MFYIRCFKQLIKKSPIFLTIYFLIAFTGVIGLHFSSNIVDHIELATAKTARPAFFHALIDNKENYSRVSRKLRSLPGVRNVEVFSPEKMEEEAKKILKDLDVASSAGLLELGQAGLKIIFESNVQIKSMELVRDYLLRLVGEENITFGDIINENVSDRKESWSSVLTENMQWFFIGIVFILWLLINMIYARVFNNQIYLIQNFQRRKNISLKLYFASGFILIAVPSLLLALYKASVINIFLAIAFFVWGYLPHLRKWQWATK